MLVVEGRAFHRGELTRLAIGIEDGRIARIRKVLAGDERRDFGDAVLLPGGVDLHCHFRDPGFPAKDDLHSGTWSAAVGGVTCAVDMPNTKPATVDRESLEDKIRRIRDKANIDVAPFAGPTDAASAAVLSRAPGFKVYLAETTGALKVDRPSAESVLRVAAGTGQPVSVHAEDPERFVATTVRTLSDHDASRPAEAEVSAIRWLTSARGTARVHVAHVTTADAVEALRGNATCEVTPHHLLLDATRPLASRGKVNPPLRGPGTQEGLWRKLVAGEIDCLASDHAPHTIEEKDAALADAPAGVPGVATTLPLLLRFVRRGVLPLDRFVDAFATRPADLLGLRKGRIEVGYDADLVAVDPRRIATVTARACRYRCGWTPFEGFEATFPLATFVRGELVVEGGEIVAERTGRPITAAKG